MCPLIDRDIILYIKFITKGLGNFLYLIYHLHTLLYSDGFGMRYHFSNSLFTIQMCFKYDKMCWTLKIPKRALYGIWGKCKQCKLLLNICSADRIYHYLLSSGEIQLKASIHDCFDDGSKPTGIVSLALPKTRAQSP